MKKLVGYAIGLAVFAFILSRIDISRTAKIILAANPLLVLLASVMVIPMILLESLRWHYILKQLKMDYPFRESFMMFASSLYIGFVTPARVGEFVRVAFLRGHSLGKSFFSVFIDRLADVLFLFGVGYLGMFYFASALGQQIFWLSAAVVGGLLLLVVAFLKKDLVKVVLKLVFGKIVPEKFKAQIKSAFIDFYSAFWQLLSFKSAIIVFGITLLSWIVYYTQVYLLAMALGIEISYFNLATVVSVAGILSLLPISISGIGTRDAAFVFFFALLGIASEFAVALSALVLFLMVLVALACFPFYLKKPANLNFFEGKGSK